MELKNITIGKYLSLPEQLKFRYDLVYDYIKPLNSFNGKECNLLNLTFDEVSVVKKILANPKQETIKKLFEICYSEESLLKCSIFDYFQAKKYIDEEVIRMVEREKKLLKRLPNKKGKKVNTEDLNKFGSLNTKIEIGQMFGVNPYDVGNWKYNDVLHIQAYNTTVNNIQSQMK